MKRNAMSQSINLKRHTHSSTGHAVRVARRQAMGTLWEMVYVLSRTGIAVGIGFIGIGLFMFVALLYMARGEAMERLYFGPSIVGIGLLITVCCRVAYRISRRRIVRYRFRRRR